MENVSRQGLKKLNEYLAYLSRDGGWHSLDDIAENISLNKEKVKLVTEFYAEFNFVTFKEAEEKTRINPNFRKLYME